MALTTVSVSHYRSDCEEELPHKMGKKGANMLILHKDSSVEYDQDEMGQSEQGHSDDEAEVQENQDEVQEKQDDDDEET